MIAFLSGIHQGSSDKYLIKGTPFTFFFFFPICIKLITSFSQAKLLSRMLLPQYFTPLKTLCTGLIYSETHLKIEVLGVDFDRKKKKKTWKMLSPQKGKGLLCFLPSDYTALYSVISVKRHRNFAYCKGKNKDILLALQRAWFPRDFFSPFPSSSSSSSPSSSSSFSFW